MLEHSSGASQPVIELTSVEKHYPTADRNRTVRAVNGVSLRIYAGETLGVVGESGCGKSTLARLIMRLEPLTAGEVHLADTRGASSASSIRSRVQMVFQDPYASLDPRRRILFSLTEPLRVHTAQPRAQREAAARAACESVGLPATMLERYPHELSGGQRQRVSIARALILHPHVLICDEPVSALDVSVQAQVLNLLTDLKKRLQLASLFISHDMAVIRHVSDRVAVMYLGKIVEMADTETLLTSPKHPYTKALIAAAPRIENGAELRPRPLRGELPDPASPPSGCPFQPRCPVVMDRCKREAPQLMEVAPGHVAACHLESASPAEAALHLTRALAI